MDQGKSLCFFFTWAEKKTTGGLVTQPASSSYFKNSLLRNHGLDPYYPYTSLAESILCPDSFQSMYSQMLCGLYDRLHVHRIKAIFASSLIRIISFLHFHYNELCHDIATGTLNKNITYPSLQLAMSKIMKPDPALARTIQEECSRENWEAGIIKRIWPNTIYLDVIVTGSMAQYIPTLDHYSDGLPIFSTSYKSSECYIGLNLRPTADPYDVAYTIMPHLGYFEFMPLDSSSSNTLVDLADVEVGKDYELVITTYTGLYRYCMGDIVRATSFHNSSPEFQFIRRKNILLSIDSDKTDEADLQKAINNASLLLGQSSDACIAEYTSHADTKTIPGHYVIYLDLKMLDDMNGRWPTDDLLRRCCLEMEESLNSMYIECRAISMSVGPLEIRIVRHGTFEEVMAIAIAKGASISQYKMPRCISHFQMLELLNKGVISSHFSPALPKSSRRVGGAHNHE